MVRFPPELHRRLALETAESGVSLNRLASDKLSSAPSEKINFSETAALLHGCFLFQSLDPPSPSFAAIHSIRLN